MSDRIVKVARVLDLIETATVGAVGNVYLINGTTVLWAADLITILRDILETDLTADESQGTL